MQQLLLLLLLPALTGYHLCESAQVTKDRNRIEKYPASTPESTPMSSASSTGTSTTASTPVYRHVSTAASTATSTPTSTAASTAASTTILTSTSAATSTEESTPTSTSRSTGTSTAASTSRSTPAPRQGTTPAAQAGKCVISMTSNINTNCGQNRRVGSDLVRNINVTLSHMGSETFCCQNRVLQMNAENLTENNFKSKNHYLINCQSWQKMSAAKKYLFCADECNTTIKLLNDDTSYRLFLPTYLPANAQMCHWRLSNATHVTIRASNDARYAKRQSFLCVGRSEKDCDASKLYPSSQNDFQSHIVKLSCSSLAECVIGYNYTSARANGIGWLDYEIYVIKNLSEWATLNHKQRLPSASADKSSMDTSVPFEFLVSRAIIAGVLCSFCIILCIAACTWAYYSWNYRAYTSPIRRMLHQTPLHSLPAYRTSTLVSVQLNQAASRRESNDSAAAAAAAGSSFLSYSKSIIGDKDSGCSLLEQNARSSNHSDRNVNNSRNSNYNARNSRNSSRILADAEARSDSTGQVGAIDNAAFALLGNDAP